MIGSILTVNGVRLRVIYEQKVLVTQKEGGAFEYTVVGTERV